MNLKDFTTYLNSVRPGSDHTAEVWYDWAKELERMDSSEYELPKGEYKTAEVFLDEFVENFRFIREKHGDKVAGQVISLADVPACPFPWEMWLAAVHFAKSGSIEDISAMEADGTLEEYKGMEDEEDSAVQIMPL